MPVTAYITHSTCAKHDMGLDHPESPQRLAAINDTLIHKRIMDLLRVYEAEPVSSEQLKRVHTHQYVQLVQDSAPLEGLVPLDADTSMNAFSLEAAQLAAGAVVQAVDLLMQDKADNAFCAVRPPGHHAEHDRAMGFCIFNNIAVGVAHALQQYGLKRVAIVDFDVHHGNGTEDIFQDDSRVILCSTFQSPFYPYRYGDSMAGHLVNVPLPAGTTSQVFREAVEQQWLPALNQFDPEMIFISAGFDAHKDDPLAGFNLVEDDYAWVTEQIKSVAARCCANRIISSLEGGYHLSALGASVAAHVGVLAGLHLPASAQKIASD
ncbi:histone deacetylase family protein [Teredinibacter haidensis]|mgnify:CR=1 FL=1|uniref:histone deacetylase family protein n=1 Tax=Teredinibacter haidensis TaxID=2731755 RepID=UPI0009489D20|nr:histone deacetylase family protein [Teredinibacter haidensis]